MDFLQKYVYGVFELPLPGNAPKCTKKKSDGGWGGVGFSKCTGRSVDFFCRPLDKQTVLARVLLVPPLGILGRCLVLMFKI
jgi:hypothetical protein